jgi:tight adherence protein C
VSISDLSPLLFGLRVAALLLFALALAIVAAGLLSLPAITPPRLGTRGRQRALARSDGLFKLSEPLVSTLGGFMRALPAQRLRERLDQKLRVAGEPAGLCADELLALTLLSGLGVAGLGPLVSQLTALHWGYAIYLSVVGPALPILRLSGRARERSHELERSLPSAIDLCVLCMGAGCDFPAALRFVVGDTPQPGSVCHEQLSRVLDDLALGRTRVEALEALAARTTSPAVREFVAAVCQSEQKGTPLVDSLSIQASTLRLRRSVRAEELAARASVKMMLPLLLLVSSLMLVIFGPFIVTGGGL